MQVIITLLNEPTGQNKGAAFLLPQLRKLERMIANLDAKSYNVTIAAKTPTSALTSFAKKNHLKLVTVTGNCPLKTARTLWNGDDVLLLDGIAPDFSLEKFANAFKTQTPPPLAMSCREENSTQSASDRVYILSRQLLGRVPLDSKTTLDELLTKVSLAGQLAYYYYAKQAQTPAKAQALFGDDGEIASGVVVTPQFAINFAAAVANAINPTNSICLADFSGTNAAAMIKNTLCCAFCAEGVKVWDVGKGNIGELLYAASLTSSRLALAVAGEVSTNIYLYDGHGRKISDELENLIESVYFNINSHRRTVIKNYAAEINAEGLKELYADKLRSEKSHGFSGIKVSYQSSGRRDKEVFAAIFEPQSSQSVWAEITFHANLGRQTVTAYSEETGYVFWERLCLVAAKYDLERGKNVTLPDIFPKFCLNLTQNNSAKLSFAPLKPPLEGQPPLSDWVTDPICLALCVVNFLVKNNLTLKNALKTVPDIYCTRRFLPLEFNTKAQSDRFNLEKVRAKDADYHLKALKNGGVMLSLAAHDSETAASLCDEIEQMLRQLNND